MDFLKPLLWHLDLITFGVKTEDKPFHQFVTVFKIKIMSSFKKSYNDPTVLVLHSFKVIIEREGIC